jgi:hypothetical protein
MLGGVQPYTAMARGKAGALDDLMTRTQALCVRLPWHRNIAYVDPRVLGMRVPLVSKASLPDAGASRTRHRAPVRHVLFREPARYHACIAGAQLGWRASVRWTAEAAIRHLPDLHMERSLWESGSCGESRFTKRSHAPDCWLTSVTVCKPMSLGLHAATATRTRPATHCGVRLSPLHNLRTISTFFAQMRQTTPDSSGTFFDKWRNIVKKRWTKCRCFIHPLTRTREWIVDSGEAGCI